MTSPTVGVVGHGVVGARVVQRLGVVIDQVETVPIDTRSVLVDVSVCDAVILAHPGPHAPLAAEILRRGVSVVSAGDALDDVREMLALDGLARSSASALVVGAAMCPGLTGLLARHLAAQMATHDEIHIAVHGTAGPSCARHHHRSLGRSALGYSDGEWIRRPAGSGRELCFFPEPVGGYDCYRAELASPFLLHEVFPDAERISAKVSANRRDRLTARLPMLSPPHREGGVGAVRVELRGNDATGGRVTTVLGIAELVGTAAAATAVALTKAVLAGEVPPGATVCGDPRLDTVGLLRTIEHLGVRIQEFTGVPSVRRIAA